MTEQILAVQRMQDYIEAHLSETITPAALAAARARRQAESGVVSNVTTTVTAGAEN